MINLALSISLFLYNYGMERLLDNGIYPGGLLVLVMYYLVSERFVTNGSTGGISPPRKMPE